ncbi:NucA/NucB deoxyribonuclease domain-containing protein [Rhodococcoides corynebacterioides]|uniref:NucA/NucB deoxyribonuclease domain-containing protein n=1 Tax=Rhodococcoides corynebacterioides TaxID=53972 RepID=UPI0012E6FEF6|nr:hypothetical protein [Rhodococcus corynebacterioides]
MGDRNFQCRTKVIQIGVANRQTGVYFGTIYIEEQRSVKLAWNNTAWDEALSVRVQNIIATAPGSQPLLESVQLKWELSCQYGFIIPCYNNGGAASTIGPQSALALRAGFTTTTRKGAVTPGGGSVNAQSAWRFTSTSAQASTATGTTGYTPIIRCDAGVGLRNSQGCAYTHVAPELDYTERTDLGDFLNHVRAAQDSGLPGAYGGSTLERVTPTTTIRQNRAGSCGGVTGPRGSGKTCDEYPFASTNQGARVNGPFAGSGRTFANCGIQTNNVTLNGSGSTGYSVCLIDRGQNSRAGAYLGWFYAKNRVMDGDSFHVTVR